MKIRYKIQFCSENNLNLRHNIKEINVIAFHNLNTKKCPELGINIREKKRNVFLQVFYSRSNDLGLSQGCFGNHDLWNVMERIQSL
jgi:hypothetical protein